MQTIRNHFLCETFHQENSRNRPKTSKEQTERPRMINKTRVRVHTSVRISTYNVRTLKRIGKLYQLIKGCSKNKLDIIAIQEHRLQTKSDIDTILQPEFTFYYSSANSSGNCGIGLLVRKHLINSISNVSKISERIISVTFQCNPVINIIVTYEPTETSSEQEQEQSYNDLNDNIASILQHNFVVITEDFNACIGSTSHETSPSVLGSYMYHDQTKTNDQYLVDFCGEQNLISVFHCQSHKRNCMWV